MSCWAIGDVQGCADQLQALLQAIQFHIDRDQLWLCGDLVNRGPHSLRTLRWLYQHRDQVTVVLGNHDLHLLAVAAGCRDVRHSDTFTDVLQAPDREQLLSWLMQQPLAVFDASRQVFMSHAGLPPAWTASAAVQYGNETMTELRRDPHAFFSHMYGNEPTLWRDDLHGAARSRYTINALTRMRYVDAHGGLELKHKGALSQCPPTLMPWFRYQGAREQQARIVFGHWAALQGRTDHARCIALDTGCVWGNRLTAFELDSGRYVDVAGWQSGATLALED